jgi:hypothetical protein
VTVREKIRLLRAIAAISEVAYRRGFQHGFHAGRECAGITESEVLAWRHSPAKLRNRRTHSRALSPWARNTMTPLSRAIFEAGAGGAIEDFMRADPAVREEDNGKLVPASKVR